MKRFLPSSVMLMPFVVKHYAEQKDEDEMSCDPCDTQSTDCELNLSANNEASVNKTPADRQPKKE